MVDYRERILPLPEFSLDLSPDETARLKPIQDAVTEDNAQKIISLLHTLTPPLPYLQRQLFPAVARGKLAAARCLVEQGI